MTTPTTPLFPCPCCQTLEFAEAGAYEICTVCGWEDDPIQSAYPDYEGGANKGSLNKCRAEWLARLRVNEQLHGNQKCT
jgi:hypothetical protein